MEVSEPRLVHGLEVVQVEIEGQSFMLHQIRKMIGLAVALVRDRIPDAADLLRLFLDSGVPHYVPLAPSFPLLLQWCHFDAYNRRIERIREHSGHELSSLAFHMDPELRSRMEAFRNDVLYPHIAEIEINERRFAAWLARLDAQPVQYHLVRCRPILSPRRHSRNLPAHAASPHTLQGTHIHSAAQPAAVQVGRSASG